MLLGLSAVAQAQDGAVDCSAFPNATIDGLIDPAPSNLNVDTDCTVRNFPASNPFDTNISFYTAPGQTDTRHLLIFDNVVHTKNMSCAVVHNHMLWFVNSSVTSVSDNCINWLLAVEKIDKRNPPGDAATVGVPFTYRLVIPVLFTPDWDENGNATGTIDYSGSPNELHSVFVTDDLNETGVDLVYESHTVTWADSGAPVSHLVYKFQWAADVRHRSDHSAIDADIRRYHGAAPRYADEFGRHAVHQHRALAVRPHPRRHAA